MIPVEPATRRTTVGTAVGRAMHDLPDGVVESAPTPWLRDGDDS